MTVLEYACSSLMAMSKAALAPFSRWNAPIRKLFPNRLLLAAVQNCKEIL